MVIHGLQALRKEQGANASPPNLHYLFKRLGSHYVNRLSVSPAIEFSNFGKGRGSQINCHAFSCILRAMMLAGSKWTFRGDEFISGACDFVDKSQEK